MKRFVFSDLACENERNGNKSMAEELRWGIKRQCFSERYNGGSVKYVTYFADRFGNIDNDAFYMLQKSIAGDIADLIKQNCNIDKIDHNISILVVGLGNSHLTPDSLGCETVKLISATHHLGRAQIEKLKLSDVSTVIPDVTGNTGIETVELVKATVSCIKPNVVIIVDSLASKSVDRLASTVQLSTNGITPGSGISRTRKTIDSNTLGVPIISVGVPTVVNSATLMADVLKDKIGENDMEKIMSVLRNHTGFFVTPKEIDIIIEDSALLLSGAIKMALK